MGRLNERPLNFMEMMNDYTVDDLKTIGAFLVDTLKECTIKPRGLDIPSKAGGLPTRKADRVEWTRSCLSDTSFLTFVYEKKLTDIEQAALQETVYNGGVINWDQFKAKYGDIPRFSLSRYGYGWTGEKKPFVFPPLVLFMTYYGMPGDIYSLLSPLIPKPAGVSAKICETLPETVEVHGGWDDEENQVPLIQHATEQAATNDLMIMLHLVEKGKISVSAKTGRPTKATCKNIRHALTMGDFYPEETESHNQWDIQMEMPMPVCGRLPGP